MIKSFFNRILQFYYSTNKKEVLLQSKLRQEIHSIKKREFKKDNKNLIPFGFKVFSQTDEDGIINEIFNRIGTTNKQFLEFGADSRFNNTTYLLMKGWKGVWLESSEKKVNNIKKKYYPDVHLPILLSHEIFSNPTDPHPRYGFSLECGIG